VSRRKNSGSSEAREFLALTLERIKSLESVSVERLTRVEEGLRLLRQDLMGNGQPGRIPRLEADLNRFRTAFHRQRGILTGISIAISTVIGLIASFLGR